MTGATTVRRAAFRVLQVMLLAAIAWGIYRVLAPELSQLSRSDLTQWRPDAAPLIGSTLLLVGVYLAHALLWRRIMRDLDIARPDFRTTVRVYFLASLGRYLPGKVWQLAGLAVLADRAGMPPGRAAAAAVLGQFAFLTTGLLFLGITLPEWATAIGAGDGGGTGAGAGAGAAVTGMGADTAAGMGADTAAGMAANGSVAASLPLAIGAVLLIAGGGLIWLLVATPVGHGFRERVVRAFGERGGARLGAAFALADRVRPRDAALWAAAYAATWVALGAAFLLFVAAFHAPVVEQPRFVAGTVAAAYLVGYLFIVVPAGIGVREGAMLLLLQQVMPPSGALVVSVLSRVWFTVAELVPLAFLPVLRPAGSAEEDRR